MSGDRILFAGATGGLGALACATVSPGEEVLILSLSLAAHPRDCDPLHHGVPVEVPILGIQDPDAVIHALELQHI